jgi:DNA repair exonuclease SbcCD ATPase subunit
MRDIFEQLNSRQTLIVSHEQKVEGFVDHVIKIKKEGKSMLV